MQNKPIVIGIAGGSGSGKTSVTYEVCKRFSKDSILVIEQDSYYKDQSEKTFSERLLTNYDHPDAFDNELLIKQLKQLMNYETILKPSYDYKQHTRSSRSEEHTSELQSRGQLVWRLLLVRNKRHSCSM